MINFLGKGCPHRQWADPTNRTRNREIKECEMSVDIKALQAKLKEIYPEIDRHKLTLETCFDDKKDAWIVQLSKGSHELRTHLEKKDAEECIDGIECVYLGVQIGQFVKNFEASD
jgi:hypothetical protein